MPKFKNKNGTFTLYALCCGSVQETTIEKGNGYNKKQLYVEHGHIHVQTIIVMENGDNDFESRIHEVFEIWELTKARKLFNSIKF